MQFSDKVVLVAGGSSGIGLATAQAFAAAGAHVWLVARDTARLESALDQVSSLRCKPGQCCGFVSADLSLEDAAQAAVRQVAEAAGLPDIVVNSAGAAHPGYFQELDRSIFRWMMDANYYATINVVRAVVPAMIERGSGHIVNVCSAAAFLPAFGYTAYAPAKYAVRGFSEALRCELMPYGIRVSIVYPPDTDTPQLAYEDQYKPAETRLLAGTIKPLKPATVAAAIVNGVASGRYIILPDLGTRLLYLFRNVIGSPPIIDYLIADARRKLRTR